MSATTPIVKLGLDLIPNSTGEAALLYTGTKVVSFVGAKILYPLGKTAVSSPIGQWIIQRPKAFGEAIVEKWIGSGVGKTSSGLSKGPMEFFSETNGRFGIAAKELELTGGYGQCDMGLFLKNTFLPTLTSSGYAESGVVSANEMVQNFALKFGRATTEFSQIAVGAEGVGLGRASSGVIRDHARNNFNISNKLKQNSFTPAFNQIESFFTNSAFDGALYPNPKEKLPRLVSYLEKRGISVYITSGTIDKNPKFIGMRDGTGKIYLPDNPTVLQVKHELSHYLDFKKLGVLEYVKLSRYERERLVLERLKNNRLWSGLNDLEREFSVNYVGSLKPQTNIMGNSYE